MEAELCQPASAPNPVAGDGIDNQADRRGIENIGFEVRALGHGTRDNRCRRSAKDCLEECINPCRQRTKVIYALHERVERANKRVRAAKHQAKTNDPIARRANAEVHEVLHQDIARVLGTSQTSLAQCKAGLHEIDQKRRNERPSNISRTEHTVSPLLIHFSHSFIREGDVATLPSIAKPCTARIRPLVDDNLTDRFRLVCTSNRVVTVETGA